MEYGTLPRFRLDPDAPSMPIYDLLTNGKSDAGAGIFAAGVQALKNKEDALEVLRFDADTIITHTEMPGTWHFFNCYVDLWWILAAEFDGIADQILE